MRSILPVLVFFVACDAPSVDEVSGDDTTAMTQRGRPAGVGGGPPDGAGGPNCRTVFADADDDGFGDAGDSLTHCGANDRNGYVDNDMDCDDTVGTTYPGAPDTWYDGADSNCDGADDFDQDGDGFASDGYGGADCDDTTQTVSPAEVETCNGIDDNCDGSIDESGAIGEAVWFTDADGDGFGLAGTSILSCDQPTGYTADDTDCDDAVSTTYPGAPDAWYDGADSNCDGANDFDQDADGYALDATGGADCDDTSATISPVAVEVCNDVDDDCDGTVDGVGALGAETWFLDADGDGYGDLHSPVNACAQPDGYVRNRADCNDALDYINPRAPESCDGIDTDCNASTSEAGMVSFGSGAGPRTDYTDTQAIFLSSSGTLQFCTNGAEHVFNKRVTVSGAATVTMGALGGGLAVLDASDEFHSSIYVTGEASLRVADIEVRDSTAGTAVSCSGDASVEGWNFSIVNSRGQTALSVTQACVFSLFNSEISGHESAEPGSHTIRVDGAYLFTRNSHITDNVSTWGALKLNYGAAELNSTLIADNTSTGEHSGGNLHLLFSDVSLTKGTELSGGIGGHVGGAQVHHSTLRCEASSILRNGDIGVVIPNLSAGNGAVDLQSNSEFIADNCNLGTGSTDNFGFDISTDFYDVHRFGMSTTVTCVANAGCE